MSKSPHEQSRHPHYTHADDARLQELFDSLPECPTEAQAEEILQACGTSGKEVVNEFIDRLLCENLELKQKLFAPAAQPPTADAEGVATGSGFQARDGDPEDFICVACSKPAWAHSCNRPPLSHSCNPAATRMRDACVEKARSMRDRFQQAADASSLPNDLTASRDRAVANALTRLLEELKSLTLDQVEQEKR